MPGRAQGRGAGGAGPSAGTRPKSIAPGRAGRRAGEAGPSSGFSRGAGRKALPAIRCGRESGGRLQSRSPERLGAGGERPARW